MNVSHTSSTEQMKRRCTLFTGGHKGGIVDVIGATVEALAIVDYHKGGPDTIVCDMIRANVRSRKVGGTENVWADT